MEIFVIIFLKINWVQLWPWLLKLDFQREVSVVWIDSLQPEKYEFWTMMLLNFELDAVQ